MGLLPPEHTGGLDLAGEQLKSETCVTGTRMHSFRGIEERKIFLSITQNPENIREKIVRPEHIKTF